MSTIRDVAREAGVSVGTVSNYLNASKPVGKKTSARIKAAVDRLGYVQNLAARNLRAGTYPEIGVLLPNLNDSCCVQIWQGLARAFQNAGYDLNIAFSYDIPELESGALRSFLHKNVCGLVLMPAQPQNSEFLRRRFLEAGKPLVLLERAVPGLQTGFVRFESERAVRAVTELLIKSGRSRPFLFCGPEGYSCEDACVRAFAGALRDAGRPCAPEQVVRAELNREDAFRKLANLLRTNRPDAVVTTTESAAAGVTEGLRLLGVAADEIPVCTLGEEHWNRQTHSFAAFSAERPAIRMGAAAAELLLGQLKSPGSVPAPVVLPCRIPSAPALPAPPPRRPAPPADTLRILMVDTPFVRSFRSLLPNFEARTGIRAELTLLPHRNLLGRIEENFRAGGESPFDVCLMDIPWLPALAANGVLAELGSLFKTLDESVFFPGCLDAYSRFRGGYYGLPFLYAPQIFYYRKDLFESPALRAAYERFSGLPLRPPLALEEYALLARFFTDKTGAVPYGAGISAAYDECLAPEVYFRLRACGGALFDRRGRAVFDSPAARRACSLLLGMLPCVKPDYLKATDVSIVDDFLAGETAMVITYPPFLADQADLRKSSLTGSIGCALIPGRAPLLGGWSFGISSRTKKRAQADAFLRWSCDEQIVSCYMLLGGHSAVLSAYTNDELVNLYPWLPLYRSAYELTRPTRLPDLPDGRIVSSDRADAAVCRQVYRMLLGKASVEEGVVAAQAELEALLAEARSGF
jgi:multiple sugar transport system substrate-binding protein